jgi:hypothetical protein
MCVRYAEVCKLQGENPGPFIVIMREEKPTLTDAIVLPTSLYYIHALG